MIPLIALINFFSFLISFGITCKLYSSYKKNKSILVTYFFLSFVFLSLFFFLLSAPGLIISNSAILASLAIFTIPFGLIGTAIFTIISFSILHLKRLMMLYIGLVSVAVITVLILNIISFRTPIEVKSGIFLFWITPTTSLSNIAWFIGGVGMFVSIVLSSVFFLIHGLKSRDDNYIYKRSLLISSGVFLLALSAALTFLAGPIIGIGRFLFVQTAFLTNAGLIILAAGIFLKNEDQKKANGQKT